MEAVPDILRMFFALGIVILLMLLIAYAMRRYPVMQKFMGAGQAPRMQIISSLMLDVRHRLVIVRIDDKEKIFLLSPESAQEVS